MCAAQPRYAGALLLPSGDIEVNALGLQFSKQRETSEFVASFALDLWLVPRIRRHVYGCDHCFGKSRHLGSTYRGDGRYTINDQSHFFLL